jgi:3-dehydroquinate dehydratase-2
MAALIRIEVMHGVNLDMLGKREPEHYGTLTLDELERQIEGFAGELGVETRFFHSNFEGEYVEHLHSLRELVDGVILNPGAWTHYAWAIHDALAIAALPAVEVHLSDVKARESWRQLSVIEDLCIASVSGNGIEGYRLALERLRDELGGSERSGEPASAAGQDPGKIDLADGDER